MRLMIDGMKFEIGEGPLAQQVVEAADRLRQAEELAEIAARQLTDAIEELGYLVPVEEDDL